MVVAGTAQIGVIEQGRRRPIPGGGSAGFAREKCGDAFAVERADFERAGGDGLGARRINAAIELQNAEAGSKALLGMAPAGEHGRGQPLGVRPDPGGPATESVRRPLGIAPMRTGHVRRIRAEPRATVAALVQADALTAVEYLDHPRGGAHVDLGVNEGMRAPPFSQRS